MDISQWSQLLALLADAASLFGIPIAILLLIRETNREKREREDATYDSLDDKYIDYLTLCLQYPRLGLYPMPYQRKRKLSPEERIQQYAMFEILVSILERAYIKYRSQSRRVRQKQWEGWRNYIEEWVENKTFLSLWKELGEGYDQDFQDYMTSVIRGKVA